MLVDLIGSEMGQLDQELDKLAVYVGSGMAITASDVDKLVGSSRAENTWKIFDAIGAGQTGAALTILDRLFEQGEEPLRTLGAFSSQLRRLVTAARLNEQGQPLGQALERAGIPPFAVRGCEQQLRHLGRQRVNQLYDWLLEVDLGLKGSSQLPARTLLERLVVQLAPSRGCRSPRNPAPDGARLAWRAVPRQGPGYSEFPVTPNASSASPALQSILYLICPLAIVPGFVLPRDPESPRMSLGATAAAATALEHHERSASITHHDGRRCRRRARDYRAGVA